MVMYTFMELTIGYVFTDFMTIFKVDTSEGNAH